MQMKARSPYYRFEPQNAAANGVHYIESRLYRYKLTKYKANIIHSIKNK